MSLLHLLALIAIVCLLPHIIPWVAMFFAVMAIVCESIAGRRWPLLFLGAVGGGVALCILLLML